jgi:SAM-dependent methyltransferase
MMKYHAFLSYNSKNSDIVRLIYDYLTNSGLRIFFDKEDIPPGEPFQKKLEDALRESASILVLVGQAGVGPWQEVENYEFQILNIGRKNRKIIPVILPNAEFNIDIAGIPMFLHQLSKFAFTSSVDNKDDLFRLMQAIPRTTELLEPFERPFLREEQERLFDKTIDFYNKEAGRYFDRWKDIIPLPPIYAFLEQVNKLSPVANVLDVGCGPGHHSNFLAMHSCHVEGLDASTDMIRIANQNKTFGTNFRVADMRDLQKVFGARNLFDGIWACASCVHITKEAFGNQLYEFLAVLKPGGVLGISMQVGVPSAIQDDGRFFERYEENDLLEKLSRYGFINLNINTQITDRNTMDKRQIKKWMNITAVTPQAKERINLLDKLEHQGH